MTRTKSKANPKVDPYFKGAENWQQELKKLRAIVLDSGLAEELKWGKPCYNLEGRNLIIIYALKESCAIAFFNGALLKDPHKILIMPGPNSQAGRWIKFNSVQDVAAKEAIVKAYLEESIQAEKSGLKVIFKRNPEPVPEELQRQLDKSATFKAAFEALTPGRQRGYILYFSSAKQSQTRASRIEKHRQRILDGKGLMDR